MKTFDFYEFAGILVPGSLMLVAIILVYPQVSTVFPSTLTVGDLGLFVVIAYATGHVIQAIGNLVEQVWWTAWKGRPTDWVRTGIHLLLAEDQLQTLKKDIATKLNIHSDIDSDMEEIAWRGIIRQIYAAVAAQARNSRVDIFNGNYGLTRGIATSLLTATLLLLYTHGFIYWQIVVLLLLCAGISLFRMKHFGVLYAQELFAQFLQVSNGRSVATLKIDDKMQTKQDKDE